MYPSPEPATAGKPEPLLLSERDAAAMLGISSRTLWTLAKRGEVPCVRIGSRKMYSLETLRRFVAARETKGGCQ